MQGILWNQMSSEECQRYDGGGKTPVSNGYAHKLRFGNEARLQWEVENNNPSNLDADQLLNRFLLKYFTQWYKMPYERIFTYCDDCGRLTCVEEIECVEEVYSNVWFRRGNIRTYVCQECAKKYKRCKYCGDLCTDDRINYDRQGNGVCNLCYTEYDIEPCQRCGVFLDSKSKKYDKNNNWRCLCKDCYDTIYSKGGTTNEKAD